MHGVLFVTNVLAEDMEKSSYSRYFGSTRLKSTTNDINGSLISKYISSHTRMITSNLISWTPQFY